MRNGILTLFAGILCVACTGTPDISITARGELEERISRNFDMMETPRYQPENVFKSALEDWPGDIQGRTILALVRDAQSSGRQPLYLDRMIETLPDRMNGLGYFGPIYEGRKNEQQLSGHGWLLRGLCEYYRWTGSEDVLNMIKDVVYNLFMVNPGDYADYPIRPEDRTLNVGEAIGSNDKTIGNWILSTDVGCIFIATDGLIEANELLKDPEVDEVINDVIGKFLEFDPVGIRAQAHASLTGCRALLRYCFQNGNDTYLKRVEEVWNLYKEYCMTENYENYNWFCRYDAHSEPCAIVDSYMVAWQLWQLTGDEEYLDDAELIYYNGICHTQHDHGGFGLDNNPGLAIASDELTVNRDEVYWCCTMRGAEGFWSVLNSSYLIKDGTVFVPFYYGSTLEFKDNGTLEQDSEYPFGERISFDVNTDKVKRIALRAPSWMLDPKVMINGKETGYRSDGGFIFPEKSLKKGDRLEMDFHMEQRVEEPVNRYNTEEGQFRICLGPLVLGSDTGDRTGLKPIYHLMDPEVKVGPDYHKQILFQND